MGFFRDFDRNALIYKYSERIVQIFQVLSFLFSFSGFALLMIYNGFPLSFENEALLIFSVEIIFLFFIINFIVKLFFNLETKSFLRQNYIEALLVLLLTIDILSNIFTGSLLSGKFFTYLGFQNFREFYLIFLQIYFFLFVGLDAIKLTSVATRLKIKPAVLLIGSFAFFILIGTLLLMMPEMSTVKGSMPFVDALFMSSSSICITGLAVVDVSSYFSFKGHLLLLFLIQVGGIGIITLAIFLSFFIKSGSSLKGQSNLKEMLNVESLSTARGLLKEVFVFTIIIEAIAAFFIFISLPESMELKSLNEKAFIAIFHAVSAFCHAGITLFPDSLATEELQQAYSLHLTIGVVIFLGALGFPALNDLTSLTRLRDRMKHPWKKWQLDTQVSLYSAFVLVILGMVIIFIVEYDFLLKEKNLSEKWIAAFFQSVTTRSAGFNSIDIGGMQSSMYVVFIFLMFIGGSSASTAGGIKTSTFVIIFIAMFNTIKGKKNATFKNYTISQELIQRAFAIFIFTATYILIIIFILSIFEPDKEILALAFESVSATCTVGLSMGITADLSTYSKILISITMLLGRVGVLTLALALVSLSKTQSVKYPHGKIMIG